MNHRCMATTLKPKPNHSNGSVQQSQDRKKHVEFGQIWRFCSLFSSIVTAWCIVNSWHNVVRSIRNTIVKLFADCENEFVRKAHNYGKTNHRFCTMITRQLTHQCLCVSHYASTIVFTGLRPSKLFPPYSKGWDWGYQNARFRSV